MPSASVDRRKRRFTIPVRLYGPRRDFVEANFLVDTGAVASSVDGEIVAIIGLGARDGRRMSRLVGTGEEPSLGYVLEIDTLEALGVRHSPFEIHVHDMPRDDGIDGLLGMDWLLEHVLRLDGPRGLLELLR